MTEEIIVAWKVGTDDMEDTEYENIQKRISIESVLEGLNDLKLPKESSMMKEQEGLDENVCEASEKESVSRVNSAASYGSIGSFGSFGGDDQGDEKGARLMRRKSKKISVSSNLSTFSSMSEQPYMSMMSNVSRERKLSSMSSSDNFSKPRHTSGGSARTRKFSEGIPPFISMMSKNDFTPGESVENENIRDQSWVAQNQLYGNGKKIYFKNFHGREKMRRRGEIFPGYEKTIQERATNPEEEYIEDDEHQKFQKNPKPMVSDHRRSSLNPHSLAKKQLENYQDREGTGSSKDIEYQFTRQGVRATVCSSEIKTRSGIASQETTSMASPVARSQSMKKPFKKFGDGFLKTFRQLKKK